MKEQASKPKHRSILMAFFAGEAEAKSALDTLNSMDFLLDRASLLGKASSSGDDPLGVYYPSTGERMRGWGKMGALWGGLWGLLTGAAGMFLMPGLGPLLAAGPVVEALAGAVGGAAVTGGVLAGAGALSQLAVAVHRLGVPEERLDETHERIDQGQLLLMLVVGEEEAEHWGSVLGSSGADAVWQHPYYGPTDTLKQWL